MFDWIFRRRQAAPQPGASDPEDTESKATADTLSAILRGLHHAAGSVQHMMAQQYIVLIDQYFETTSEDRPGIPKGSLIPKVVQIQVDGKHPLAVPLISLANPKGMFLREMKVEFTVKLVGSQLKPALAAHTPQDIDRSSFKVEISPRSDRASGNRSSDTTDLMVTFEAHEPPEGLMKILDGFTAQIVPRTNGTVGPPIIPGDSLRSPVSTSV
jgi:hypothetical protein